MVVLWFWNSWIICIFLGSGIIGLCFFRDNKIEVLVKFGWLVNLIGNMGW